MPPDPPEPLVRPAPSRAAEGLRDPADEGGAVWPHHVTLALFTFVWGSNFVLAEVALREMTPLAFSVARFAMGAAGLVAFHYVLCRRASARLGRRVRLVPVLEGRAWPRLLAASVCGATLAPWLGIEGLNLTYATRAAFWLALAPAASALFGLMMRTEWIDRRGVAGLVLAALGTFGLAYDGLRPGRGYGLGDVLLAAALVFAVLELHLIKPLAARHGATPVVTLRTVLGGGLYLLVAVPTLAAQPWLALGGWTWVAILAGGVVGVGAGQWAKVRALRPLGPTQVVIYGNLVPLATLLIAWLTIGEQSSMLEVAAGLLIVAGAVLLQVGGHPVEADVEVPTG